MSAVEKDGYAFDFLDAVDAFVFDEKDKSRPNFHGVEQLKCVDVIAEFEASYLFIEIKDMKSPGSYEVKDTNSESEIKNKQKRFTDLKNDLKYKYRDSFLYRHAEFKIDKPIHYICLINFNNALNLQMQKTLTKELPAGIPSKRWKQELVKSCQVLDIVKWNQNFPKWILRRLAEE